MSSISNVSGITNIFEVLRSNEETKTIFENNTNTKDISPQLMTQNMRLSGGVKEDQSSINNTNNLNNNNIYQPPNHFQNYDEAPKFFKPKKQNEFIKTDRGKIMIFIDGSNLFYTAQMMGIEIDYLKLTETLVGRDKLIRVNFYAGIDTENQLSAGWQYFMKRSGFKMITKPLQCFADGNRKANCDVEMAVDMINLANSFDTAILVSGDGDLTYAVQTLVNKGKQVEVLGNKMNTNDGLIQACDRFIDLESIRYQITKLNKQDRSF
jgi:uncharacterized LabA/DUF88 family protein